MSHGWVPEGVTGGGGGGCGHGGAGGGGGGPDMVTHSPVVLWTIVPLVAVVNPIVNVATSTEQSTSSAVLMAVGNPKQYGVSFCSELMVPFGFTSQSSFP